MRLLFRAKRGIPCLPHRTGTSPAYANDTLAAVGDLSEFSLPVRAFLKVYRWRRIDPLPWAPLRKPLAESNVALVTTAGLVLPDQPPFDDNMNGGDASFREIPADADVRSLIDAHRSETFDHAGIAADPNLAFPLDRLRELAATARRPCQPAASLVHGIDHRDGAAGEGARAGGGAAAGRRRRRRRRCSSRSDRCAIRP